MGEVGGAALGGDRDDEVEQEDGEGEKPQHGAASEEGCVGGVEGTAHDKEEETRREGKVNVVGPWQPLIRYLCPFVAGEQEDSGERKKPQDQTKDASETFNGPLLARVCAGMQFRTLWVIGVPWLFPFLLMWSGGMEKERSQTGLHRMKVVAEFVESIASGRIRCFQRRQR